MKPEVLVIDEPTSNLDPGSKWALIELLKGLEIIKVIADGATSQILADKRLLAAHGLARHKSRIKSYCSRLRATLLLASLIVVPDSTLMTMLSSLMFSITP